MRATLVDILRDPKLAAPPAWRKLEVAIDVDDYNRDADFFNNLRTVRDRLEEAGYTVNSRHDRCEVGFVSTLTLTITR